MSELRRLQYSDDVLLPFPWEFSWAVENVASFSEPRYAMLLATVSLTDAIVREGGSQGFKSPHTVSLSPLSLARLVIGSQP